VKNWCWIFFVLVIVSSCLDDPDCLRTADTALVISFIRLSDNKPDTIILYHVAGEGADSVFYKSSVEPDKLDTLEGTALLAVNPFANETLFTFVFETEEKTLKVGYKNEIRFISEDCGSEQTQYSLAILETQFDSVRVVNSRLSTSRTTNIEIYN
jgi:Family of unknown function (DUF6452)